MSMDPRPRCAECRSYQRWLTAATVGLLVTTAAALACLSDLIA